MAQLKPDTCMHHVKVLKYFPLCLTWNHAKLLIFRSVRITIISICQMKERFWELMLLSSKSKVDILWVYSESFKKKKKKLGKAPKTRFLTSDCLNHSIWVTWMYVTLENLMVTDKLFLIEWRKITDASKNGPFWRCDETKAEVLGRDLEEKTECFPPTWE